MKTTIFSGLLAAGYLLSTASAAIRVPIVKNREVEAAQLQKRGTVTETLGNARQLGLYYANITAGTPGQALALQIDTGSSDVWLPSSNARLCQTRNGCSGGSFDASASSTYQEITGDEFNISYVDGTGAVGDYFTDNFVIGNETLSDFQMGLADVTTIGTGIMGIGYSNSEASIFTGNGTEYPNLPEALVNAGLIASPAYSLWLDDLDSSTGSILFGGIDTVKYKGKMQSITVYPNSIRGNVTSFTVAFTSLTATSSTGTDQLTPNGYVQAVILDSGTTLTLLPDDIAAAVFEELGATNDQQLGAVVVPCALANNSGTLNYGFGGSGGPVVNVPMSELVLPLTLTNGRTPTYEDGTPACQLGIQAAGNLPILFGDTFLRSAYVVYDLANDAIGIAQTDFEATGSHVVEFASWGAAIPDAPTATAQATAVSNTETGIPRTEATGQVTGTGVETPVGTATGPGFSAASGFSDNAAARLGPVRWEVGAVVGAWMALMVVGGGVFVWA